MNWDLFWTVLGLAILVAIFLPLYLVELVAYHKTKFETMIEVMAKTEKKYQDQDFDLAFKHMFEKGAEND